MRLYYDCDGLELNQLSPPYEGGEITVSLPRNGSGRRDWTFDLLVMSQVSYQLLYPAVWWAVFGDLLRSVNERKCKNGQTKWPMASRWLFIPPVCNHLGEHHFSYPVLTRMAGVTGTEGRIRTFDLPLMRRALLPTELLRHNVRLKTTPWLMDLIP